MDTDTVAPLDKALIRAAKRASLPMARIALFLIYFWFGLLKVIGQSPANPLVAELMEKTLPLLSFDQFIVAFGIFEMIIGIAFILPRFERLAIALLVPHLIMTSLPLVLLPAVAWEGFPIPSMEGQYIIKNITIIALALGIIGRVRPLEAAKL